MSIESAYRRAMRSAHVQALLVSAVVTGYGTGGPPSAWAAVSSTGDVAPAPPAGGGAFAGPFRIGNLDVGSMSITGGTAISHTGPAIVGDTVTGLGIASMSGFGSDWLLTTAGADFTIANSGTGSLTVSSLAALSVNDDLFMAAQLNSMGRMTISSLGTLVDVGDDANIGQRGQAIVDILNGGRLVSDQNIIGDEPAGDGRVTVSGEFSLWRTFNTMTIADAGRARLEVRDGGRVETTAPTGGVSATIANQFGSTGTVQILGSGSLWQNAMGLTVGEFGNGTLLVEDGGRVSIGTGANLFTIGRQIGSTGIVEVRGADSYLSAALIEVGDAGDGTLRILEGGRAVTGGALIGDNASARGEALVDGIGSRWEVTGEITVSDPGEARLTISNGGLARSSGLTRVATLGRLTLDRGRLEIGNTTGLLNTGVVEGNGTIEALKVDNNAGGRMRPFGAEAMIVTGTLNNSGLVDVNAGVLEVIGPTNNQLDIDARNGAILRFGGAGLDNNAGAQLAVTSGNVDVFGAVNNDLGGEIVVGGTAVAVFHDAVTNAGTIFVQPGGDVLLLENLTFSTSSALSLPLRSSDTDGLGQVDVAGSAALAGILDIRLIGGFAPQPGDQFTVVSSGGRRGIFNGVTKSDGEAGIEFHAVYTPTDAIVLATRAGEKTWGIDADGNASGGGNWFGNVAPGGVDDRAAFTTVIHADRVVTIDAPLTIGSLYFDDDNAYMLQGANPIALDVSTGVARIDVKNSHGSGAHIIQTPLALNDNTVIDVAGGSVLNVTGAVSAAAGVSLTKQGGGTLAVSHVRADGLALGAGTVRVLPNGGAGGVSRVNSLAVATAAAARFDLTDNKMIVTGGTLGSWDGSAYTGVAGLIDSGRGNLGNALWDGVGIITSDTRAISNGDLCSLGIATAGEAGRTSFGGFSVSPTDVMVMFTWGGDANLDGQINIDDYGRIDGNVAQSGVVFGWFNGDFNYDGAINIDDYGIIDGNINRQGAAFSTGDSTSPAPGSVRAVPEPAVAGVAMLAVVTLRIRRRRGGYSADDVCLNFPTRFRGFVCIPPRAADADPARTK